MKIIRVYEIIILILPEFSKKVALVKGSKTFLKNLNDCFFHLAIVLHLHVVGAIHKLGLIVHSRTIHGGFSEDETVRQHPSD